MTASQDVTPDPIDPVLETGLTRVLGAQMLEEAQLASRS